MNEKKVICIITALFLISAGMLAPIILPRFTLEREQVPQPDLDPIANPDGIHNYTKALSAQTQRNIERLERAQRFGRWFVVSFTVFTITSFLLTGYFIVFLLSALKARSPST